MSALQIGEYLSGAQCNFSVVERVATFERGSHLYLPEHLNPDFNLTQVEVCASGAAVVLRNYLLPEFVNQLEKLALTTGFDMLDGERFATALPLDTPNAALAYQKAVATETKGDTSIYANMYPAGTEGIIHKDSGAIGPNVIMGKNPGGLLLYEDVKSGRRLSRREEYGSPYEYIDYSGGDVLIVDGVNKSHSGVSTGRIPRYSFVGYQLVI